MLFPWLEIMGVLTDLWLNSDTIWFIIVFGVEEPWYIIAQVKIQRSVDQSLGNEASFWSRWDLILGGFLPLTEGTECDQLGTLTWKPRSTTLGQACHPSRWHEGLVTRSSETSDIIQPFYCHPRQVCWSVSSTRVGMRPCPLGSIKPGRE